MREFRPIATPTRTVEIMRRFDIQMKKSLGQNFLIEPRMLEKMIEAGQVDADTTVIEIGPGIGALTQYLAHHAKQVLAFEIDQRFVGILQETLADCDNVQVVHQDILSVDFSSPEYAWLQDQSRLVVVANLPYYITTPIIMRLIESNLPFQSLVMMMQKEVAERMTAAVGTKAYGSLSVAIQLEMESEIAFIVPKNVFIPKPNVDSAVLQHPWFKSAIRKPFRPLSKRASSNVARPYGITSSQLMCQTFLVKTACARSSTRRASSLTAGLKVSA